MMSVDLQTFVEDWYGKMEEETHNPRRINQELNARRIQCFCALCFRCSFSFIFVYT